MARVHRALMDWLAAGRIRPYISAVLPLAQTVEGMRRIAGRQVQGKILVVPGRD
jgi:NADPH2:quinone reductase